MQTFIGYPIYMCDDMTYMWSAFSFLANNFLEVIDDVLVSIIVLTLGSVIGHGVHHVLYRMLKYPKMIADVITTSWRFFLIGLCLYQVIGMGSVQHFVNGFSIGIGYALQPYIMSIFNGFTLYSGKVLRTNVEVRLEKGTDFYRVESVGLFFTTLRRGDIQRIVPNSKMMNTREIRS